MERSDAKGVRLSDIARASGVSRQAVYLHFDSRTDLFIATLDYVDEVKGLNERLKALEKAETGVELLEMVVDVWGGYIPEIYGIARVILRTRADDPAINAAWNDRMDCVLDACREVIEALDREGKLATEWSCEDAVQTAWTMMAVQNWELLTIECGWTNAQYIGRMKTLLKRTFVDPL
jgi:AcrR family transcriptional regulator